MRKESLRRHGLLDKVEGTKGYELFRSAGPEDNNESANMGANAANPPGILGPREEQGASRTEVESRLQDYKGLGNAVKKFKQDNAD